MLYRSYALTFCLLFVFSLSHTLFLDALIAVVEPFFSYSSDNILQLVSWL